MQLRNRETHQTHEIPTALAGLIRSFVYLDFVVRASASSACSEYSVGNLSVPFRPKTAHESIIGPSLRT